MVDIRHVRELQVDEALVSTREGLRWVFRFGLDGLDSRFCCCRSIATALTPRTSGVLELPDEASVAYDRTLYK